MNNSSIIFLMICAFTFVPLFLAEVARRKSRPTGADFFLQSRKMGLFPMYATVFATWMSAFAFMGAISYFYEEGPVYMTTVGWDALFAILFYFVGRRIWYYGKINNYTTPADFFHDIYGSRALDLLVTGITFLFTMLYIQLQMVGGLFLIQIATNGFISWRVSGVIFFAVLIIYLWAGGLRAVAMTDIFYGALIIVTIFIAGIFLIKIGGGMEEIYTALMNGDTSHISLSGKNSGERTALWLCLFVIVPVGAFMGPQMWIRNYAAKSEKNFEALPFLLVLSSVIFIGTLLAGSAGVILEPHTDNPDALLADLVLKSGHPILTAVIFLGITAAIFSTANSQIHAIATIYAVDIHKKYINRNIPERSLVTVAKWTVLVISVLSYILLMVIPKSIFDMAIFATGGTAQLIVPVIGALLWKRSSAKGAIAGILAGVISFLGLAEVSGTDTSVCAAAGLFANAVIFIWVSLYTGNSTETGFKIGAYREAFSRRRKKSK
ncbi:MAG: sodium:solute symporter family protein [Eubacteriaceae bacterium]|nr:sodium:solute symporter family protein [Eubacteriaceae bacterium]